MLIAIAQHGAWADIPPARVLLEARTALPHAMVFRAGLALFDAFVEQRRGAVAQAHIHAQNAAERFEALQWHGYAEVARAIVPSTGDRAERSVVKSAPFLHMQETLTARESQVAALVLRGCTNREIANELTIALHTVEKHMTSIMNHLGVRSRHQVVDLLGTTPE
jgi:DNA-binding NarL/FixJ family response regulator